MRLPLSENLKLLLVGGLIFREFLDKTHVQANPLSLQLLPFLLDGLQLGSFLGLPQSELFGKDVIERSRLNVDFTVCVRKFLFNIVAASEIALNSEAPTEIAFRSAS